MHKARENMYKPAPPEWLSISPSSHPRLCHVEDHLPTKLMLAVGMVNFWWVPICSAHQHSDESFHARTRENSCSIARGRSDGYGIDGEKQAYENDAQYRGPSS